MAKARAFTIVLGSILAAGIGIGAWIEFRGDRSPESTRTQAAPGSAGFRDVAGEAGITFRMAFLPTEQGEKFKINLYDHGCGVAVGDIDGDGFDDIYFVNQLGSNALYRNKGDGTFVDITQEAGVGVGDRICVAATFADYNNDGHQDLYVTSTRGGNLLFKNMGNGKFKDVTKEAGLTCIAHSQTAVFFDYDNDGYLDLFVTNTAKWTENKFDAHLKYYSGPTDFWVMAESPIEHNILYHNNRDGTFSDVTAKAGLAGKGWGGDVAVFDFDEDGHMDLLVTNMFGASTLYRNNGDGTFTDVTKKTLGRTSWGAIGSKAFDFNNDGKLDLLIADMHSDMWAPFEPSPAMMDAILKHPDRKYPRVTGAAHQFDPSADALEQEFTDIFKIHKEDVLFGNTLFKNLGGGKFEEVSDPAHMETWWPWGIATGDFDNDGYEDVFLPSGMGYPFFYWPSGLMMNNGDGTFTDRAQPLGIEPPIHGRYQSEKIGGKLAPRSSRCAASADFRNGGRLDIVTNNFNDAPYYFQNNLPRRNYVSFRLRGTRSNRDAIGALVKIYLRDEVMVRQVQGAGGYLSQSSKTVHFGLGERSRIDRAEIRWPSGARQTILEPALNQRHDVVEPQR
jgi:enediyne biosynthesis protein E4